MRRLRGLFPAALLSVTVWHPAATLAQSQHDEEAQIGAQVYQQLSQKGQIIARAGDPAGYALLDPIAAGIARIADPQYDFPFHFILVNQAQPNAFAVPGGNVYVTNSLLKFVQNKEELAGVLCHETSHDIHHDVIHNMAKDQQTGAIIGLLGAITGLSNNGFGQLGENLAYTLQTNNFSRAVESAADHKGAITCAQAGYNPWGMVWLFRNFEKSDTGGQMEMLSDHPTDSHRIDDLVAEFRSDPALFGRFSPNMATATPLHGGRTAERAHAKGSRSVARQAYSPASRYCCAPKVNRGAGTPRNSSADVTTLTAPTPRAARHTPLPAADSTTILGQ